MPTRQRDRGNNSPPQFGQMRLIAATHEGQNGHSLEQMKAAPSGVSDVSQCSHRTRISSPIWPFHPS